MKKKKFVDTLGSNNPELPENKKIRWYERLSDRHVADAGKKLVGKIGTIAKPTNKKNAPVASNATISAITSIFTPNQKKYSALSPAQFGLILKKQRKDKGLEHSDITRELKFRESFVEALEDGRYYLLPDNYFIRGFITQYANFLGIHEDIYLAYLAEHFQDHLSIKRLLQINDIDTPPTLNMKSSSYVKKKMNRNPVHLTDLLKSMSVLVVAGLLFLGYYVFLSIGERNQANETPDSNQQQLVLRAQNNLWLRISDDTGKVLFESQVEKGKTITLPDKKDLTLTTPTASNLLFLLGEKTYRYADRKNNLENLNLNVETLMPKLIIAPDAITQTLNDDSLNVRPLNDEIFNGETLNDETLNGEVATPEVVNPDFLPAGSP